MQAHVQRRDPRVPLGILVELTHEDFDEAFEADAVDVGPGGLGMRAAFLPDVGSRLTCRFDSPDDGRRIEAPCEVVWARDTGAHVGHVGLRFTELDGEARTAIEGMVSKVAVDSSSSAPARPPREAPRKQVVEPCLDEPVDDAHAQVRLFLEGVDEAIPARVVARHPDGVRIAQKLALFRLGASVDVQNGMRRHTRIEGVSIRTEADVPELVLDLAYGPEEAPDAAPQDASAPGEASPSALEPSAEAAHPEAAPDTIPDPPRAEASAAPPPLPASEPALPEDGHVDAPTPAPSVRVIRRSGAGDVQGPVHEDDTGDSFDVMRSSRRGLRRARLAMGVALDRARPEARRLWALLLGLWTRLGPMIAVLRTRLRGAVAHVDPAARRFWARTRSRSGHFVAVVRGRLAQRMPGLAPPKRKRRQTAPPPGRSNVAHKQKQAKEGRGSKEGARTLLLSLVAFAGAAALVYALSPGAAEEVEVHREVPRAAEASTSEPAATEPAAREPKASEGESPSADEPQAPGTVPSTSPYAAQESEEGTSEAEDESAPELTQAFGAASVPDARSFLLRMSQPVEAIRGIPDEDGFSVIIPDSLSLDRAGPIAAAHPRIERSMIINRGDHAELSIRFAEGESLDYRVTARGHAIEIQLSD